MADESTCTALARVERTETFKGWPVVFVDGEPLIEDEELGRRLGYERPADIRELVSRIFSDSDVIRTVRKTSLVGGRPARVALLNRRQALKVCMRSETEIAERIQDEVVEVFFAATEGRLAAPARDVAAIVKAVVSEVLPAMQTMLQQVAANSETIGPRRARTLLARIRSVARRNPSWRSHHRRISNDLRERCGIPLSGAWAQLPARYWPDLDLAMQRVEREEMARNPPQLMLAVGAEAQG